MQIFALETDIGKTRYSLTGRGEREILTVHRHWLPFALTCVRQAVFGAVVVALAYAAAFVAPPAYVSLPLLGAWAFWAVLDVLAAYIDWRYTFLFLTSQKIVFVRQFLWFKREMMPVQIDNILSAVVGSQFWGMLPFGTLTIHLRETGATPIVMRYIHNPERIARKMSKAATEYVRRGVAPPLAELAAA